MESYFSDVGLYVNILIIKFNLQLYIFREIGEFITRSDSQKLTHKSMNGIIII